MLVTLYRNGPLRQRLRKGYVVAADDPATVVRRVLDSRPRLPAVGGRPMTLQASEHRPGSVWIDTGPVWLGDPPRRAALLTALAEAVATVAQAVGRQRGRLLPAAARAAAADRRSWLCADLHSVEVTSEVQREVCSNLLRRYAPELIALTGRAAYGTSVTDSRGSRRLADGYDQVPARYLASASARHLARVEQALRREDGVSSLSVMDVNPLGDPAPGMDSVELRLIDAQAFPTTALAHAILVQALAMRGRRLEREGRRVPAGRQSLLDQNRSRAVALGLAARLREESGNAKGESRSSSRSADDLVRRLLRDLLPELRAMEVTADELMPLVGGIWLRSNRPDAVRGENDLFARWWRTGEMSLDPGNLHNLLADARQLSIDPLTTANTQISPGSTVTVRAHLAELLRPDQGRASGPAKPGRSAERRPGERGPAERGPAKRTERTGPVTRRDKPGDAGRSEELVTALVRTLAETTDQAQMLDAIRRHLGQGGRSNVTAALGQLGGDTAKEIRRRLRAPANAVLRVRDQTDLAKSVGPKLAAALDRDGHAVVSLDLALADRQPALTAVWDFARALPANQRLLLMTNQTYRDQRDRGTQRVNIEVLLVALREAGNANG